jgi:hypothetical protein
MRARLLALAFASTIALAACGGGGGSATAPPAIPFAPAVPTATPQEHSTVPMSISIPLRTPSSSRRAPRFFSPGASSLAIYDGTTLIYVANLALDSTPQFTTVYARPGSTTVAFGSCTFTSSRATCTLTITTTIGQHAFDLIAYPVNQSSASQSTPPVFTGVISSEGEVSANLSPGTNPGQTLTMLGVAANVLLAGSASGAFNTATTFGYRIQDSTNSQIVQPGSAYDNGPVTITASPSGIVTIAPNSIATPPAAVGDQNFAVTCVNAAGGSVTISFNTRTSPNTAYASALTYSASNYSGATIATTPFTCNPDTATIPITVQGKRS